VNLKLPALPFPIDSLFLNEYNLIAMKGDKGRYTVKINLGPFLRKKKAVPII
jgi:hypothetical protein